MGNRSFAVLVIAATTMLAATSAGAAQNPPNLAGVWWSTTPTPSLKPADGSAIPFTAKGAAEYGKNKPLIKKIDSTLPTATYTDRCIPEGIPRIWGSGYPFQIIPAPGMLIFAYEHEHTRRMVYMNETFDPDSEPAFMGNSVGKWDGDNLVIESGVYKTRTFLDDTGLPHTDKLKVTEHIRKIGDGKSLEILDTIEDPELYSKPWTVRFTFASRPDTRLAEYLCAIGIVLTRKGKEGDYPAAQQAQ